MQRSQLIEQIRRQIYGGQPSDDAGITTGLVNQYLDQGLAVAAKQNYKENYQIEGVGFVNNSFYTTFKGLTLSEDEHNLYKFSLPSIPLGIGAVDGISRVVFKDSSNTVSYPGVILSEAQVGIHRSMRKLQNKIICYPEGAYFFVETPILMNQYKASITMISGGNSSLMDSELNVPNDGIPAIVEYIKAQLGFERAQPVDAANDGVSQVRTT